MATSSSSSSFTAMEETGLDKGHRVGNFHNYYEFHPPQNRLEVLDYCGILNYLKSNVFTRIKKDEHKTNTVTDDQVEREHKRIKRDEYAHDPDKAKEDNNDFKNEEINADLNVNSEWAYCDLGCNEGDLSLALSNAILKGLSDRNCQSESAESSIHCLGLDIDKELIDRARTKAKVNVNVNVNVNTESKEDGNRNRIKKGEREFHECNLNDERDHLEKCEIFLDRIGKKRFDLTSIFSTTMWIHIHGGDEGLTEFLARACDLTNYLLVEPQPSKCYRSVNVRLRKMNRPEEDISVERLKMRANIETEIDSVLKTFGFEKVILSKESSASSKESGEGSNKDSRTKWKRNLQLYKRRDL